MSRAVCAEDLAEFHDLCRDGRLYDIEKWIRASRPIQTQFQPKGRRRVSALEIAVGAGNHSMALVLLCNGYDPNLDERSPLNLALKGRRFDLVDLLLEWGADPKRVELSDLFDTYRSELWERFLGLGVDLAGAGGLADALGNHTSNKPLFGFAKRHRLGSPRIQVALEIALAHHARRGNERGVQLCLWADPHARVPRLGSRPPSGGEDDTDEEDLSFGFSAIEQAVLSDEVDILESLRPDPSRDDFDLLYRLASSESALMVLARHRLPIDVPSVLRSHLDGLTFGRSGAFHVLKCLFSIGMRWTEASGGEMANIRRILTKLPARDYVECVKLIGLDDHSSQEIFTELCRTPSMRARFVEVGFLQKESKDTTQSTYFRPTRFREVLAKAGIKLPKLPRRVDATVSIGRWSHGGRQLRLTRQELYELVWSQPVERLATTWGLSGRGLSKACARLDIPLPPRGFWAKVRSGQPHRRPSLPAKPVGEAEEIVIRASE